MILISEIESETRWTIIIVESVDRLDQENLVHISFWLKLLTFSLPTLLEKNILLIVNESRTAQAKNFFAVQSKPVSPLFPHLSLPVKFKFKNQVEFPSIDVWTLQSQSAEFVSSFVRR